jgi:ferredoxin
MGMPDLKIDGIAVSVEPGATVLEAAEKCAVEIPTLCHLKGCSPETSCMVCVVENAATGQLIAACSSKAVEGMEIVTTCARVQAARRNVLNLLLSEHVGDCEAPCRRICPAHLDIPLMLREMERGRSEAAAWIARRDLAIPVALGYVCPAPCEKGCRRAKIDSAITIRDLHRSVDFAPLKKTFPLNGKKAAVIGSGPAGLSCAWNLRMLGYACSIFDEASVPGGALREVAVLPSTVLDAEIEWLKAAGIRFELNNGTPNGADFDAVLEPAEHKLAVKAVANGKAAALALDRTDAVGSDRFDSKVGPLRETELQELTKNCAASEAEAARCLHCDCRKPESCKLRKYAEKYGADAREFAADERKHLQLIGANESVVFEPGKCIKCGMCVQITKRSGSELGLAFVGRGFNTQVTVPFGGLLQDGLSEVAAECVAACPTGALAFRDTEER